jgi:hypothetical protein
MDPDLMRRMWEGCQMIAAAARLYSGWSHRIPASIHVEAGGGGVAGDVLIIAGGPPAPHAITFEAPNAPWWKHPVFGHGPRESWHWVAQIPPRRFLKPAAENEFDGAVRVVAQVIDDWAKFAGFK